MGDLITLSLDLGSEFGWALGKNGVIEKSGEVALLSKQQDHPGRRWLRFNEWLDQHRQVTEILYEHVQAFRSSEASMVYGALRSQVQMFALVHGIRLCTMTPGQIKGDFTSNGAAKKEVICEVAMNLGWKNGTRDTREKHNEADAIALYWCIFLRRGIQPRFQQDT